MRRLGQWKRDFRDLDLVMSVNVSPVQLVSSDFDVDVKQVLERYGLLGSELCLEITENVVVGDLRRTRSTLAKLERLGVRIAIDDFGTGYSSLGHLKSLPVDTLKIDKVFVQNLDRSEGDRVIIDSIVGLAASFGLDVVAEGVESVGAVSYLLDVGCVRAQGFLMSRPKVRRISSDCWRSVHSRSPGTPTATMPAECSSGTPRSSSSSSGGELSVCYCVKKTVSRYGLRVGGPTAPNRGDLDVQAHRRVCCSRRTGT